VRAVCPRSWSHRRFATSVHEVHNWVVDQAGEFVEDLGCSGVAVGPDRGNLWVCLECGSTAVFVDEEVPEGCLVVLGVEWGWNKAEKKGLENG
jgi:hypothetical protein